MTSFGGEPSALAISLIGCLSATSTCDRATECSQPSTPAERSSSSGSGGTPRSASVLSTKSRWLCGISLSMSTGAALGGHLGGHDDVDAVRLAVGVLVHPVQHGLEVVGIVEPDAAQHTETARLADRGGHLLRRGEDEDRVRRCRSGRRVRCASGRCSPRGWRARRRPGAPRSCPWPTGSRACPRVCA